MAIMRPLSKQSLSSDQKDIAIASLLDVLFRLNKCYLLALPTFSPDHYVHDHTFGIRNCLDSRDLMSALIKFKHLFILVLYLMTTQTTLPNPNTYIINTKIQLVFFNSTQLKY